MSRSRRGGSGDGAFNPRSMLLSPRSASLAFIAMLVLGAYAPDLRSGRNGGAHALSNAATGFSGIVRLAEATGRNPVIVRSEARARERGLAVITPDHGTTDLSKILDARGPRADAGRPAEMGDDAGSRRMPDGCASAACFRRAIPSGFLRPASSSRSARQAMASRSELSVPCASPPELRFLAPAVVQTMSGERPRADRHGRRRADRPRPDRRRNLYVLSDPDLINNHGMGDQRQASAGARLARLSQQHRTRNRSVRRDRERPWPFAEPAQAGIRRRRSSPSR